ncbi:MAG: potassium channel protein [Marinifilaceae bacterium]
MIRFLLREVNRSFLKASFLAVFVTNVGIFGYMYIEEYSFIDALYMTFITITTVGFGEIAPLSSEGKIFTIFLICFSLGIIGYVISTFGKYIVDGFMSNRFRDYKINKRIRKMENHVIVVGLGRNGRQAVIELLDHDEEVVVIDTNIEKINLLKDIFPKVSYVVGDATSDEFLIKAGVKQAKALITAIPKDSDNLYVVLTAKELNKTLRIISRSTDSKADMRLKRAGAHNVVMPDRIGGTRMAKLVSCPDVVEFIDTVMLQTVKDVSLIPIFCDELSSSFENKSLKELNIRNQTGANIIGVKDKTGKFHFNPSANFVLSKDLKLFVLASPEQVFRLENLLKDK